MPNLESDLYSLVMLSFLNITFHFSYGVIIGFIVMILLLIASAFISGSEVAFFSLTPSNINSLKEKVSRTNNLILKLLNTPERLLATILIANNFVNVGIIILSTFVTISFVDFSYSPAIRFILQVIIITFLILLFGEIIPKIYATQYAMRFASFMAYPLFFLEKIFRPISSFLIYSTKIVNKKFSQAKQNISIDDLSQALDLTSDEIKEDRKILKGIVKFGNINVKEIMKSRVDIVAIDVKTTRDFSELLSVIIESGYSRIPVYFETFDNIKGIIYIKDLLPYIHKNNFFKWQSLIRAPYFVPETKKINDLLEEFQSKKIHLAIVIDEYGGTSGIVTLEDILEEIVGEINDEFDDKQVKYSKLDDKNYIFEGKTLLNDFYKIIQSDDNIFDDIKGDSDTLAGLILEIKGEIPKIYEKITYKNFVFKIESVDKRRIRRIKITINSK